MLLYISLRKRITLPKILRSLESMSIEVTVDPATAARARASVERMLAVGNRRNGRAAA